MVFVTILVYHLVNLNIRLLYLVYVYEDLLWADHICIMFDLRTVDKNRRKMLGLFSVFGEEMDATFIKGKMG